MLDQHCNRVCAHVANLQACPLVLDTKIAGYAGAETRIKDHSAVPHEQQPKQAGPRQPRTCGIDGEAGHKVVAACADIAPDFATYLFEFPFGDIYSRPGLGLREREIATIAALAVMGNAALQLKVHIEAGLKVGLTRDENRSPNADGRVCRVPRRAQRAIRGQGRICRDTP